LLVLLGCASSSQGDCLACLFIAWLGLQPI
jgi:hypothetical protein